MSDSNTPNTAPPLVTRVGPRPPARPRPGFWGAVLWCVLFMFVLMFALAATAGGILAAHAAGSDNPQQYVLDQLGGFGSALKPAPGDGTPRPAAPTVICRAIAYGMLAAQVATFFLALLVLRYRVGRDWKRQIGVRRPAALHVVLAALMVPGLIILASLVQELFVRITEMTSSAPEGVLRDLFGSVPWAVPLLAVAVGPGLVEELWCRGFLGRGLCARYGLAWGVFLTSLLFAAMHGEPSRLLVYTLMGAFLHFVYLASRSIWVPVVLHLLNNGIAVLLELIPSWTRFAEQFDRDATGLRSVAELSSLGLLLFAVGSLWSSRAGVAPPDAGESDAATAWTPEYPGISAPPPGVGASVASGPPGRVATVLTVASFVALVAVLVEIARRTPG